MKVPGITFTLGILCTGTFCTSQHRPLLPDTFSLQRVYKVGKTDRYQAHLDMGFPGGMTLLFDAILLETTRKANVNGSVEVEDELKHIRLRYKNVPEDLVKRLQPVYRDVAETSLRCVQERDARGVVRNANAELQVRGKPVTRWEEGQGTNLFLQLLSPLNPGRRLRKNERFAVKFGEPATKQRPSPPDMWVTMVGAEMLDKRLTYKVTQRAEVITGNGDYPKVLYEAIGNVDLLTRQYVRLTGRLSSLGQSDGWGVLTLTLTLLPPQERTR